MSEKILPRDAFIEVIYEYAKKDPSVYFLSADLGAKALDEFRKNLPNQFIHCGICEQTMINVAAGLAQCGKKVYVYAMGPFVTLRCFEQIKVCLASMNLPVTIIGNGVGYSYDDAGSTHYAVEDISCMRALANIEIWNPSDTESVRSLARESYARPRLRYIRLDRSFLPDYKRSFDCYKTCIISSGYMLHKAMEMLQGFPISFFNLERLNPIYLGDISWLAEQHETFVTIEEHFLNGGLGSIVCEALADLGIQKKVIRIGLKDEYILENGGRSHIQKLSGIGSEEILRQLLKGYIN